MQGDVARLPYLVDELGEILGIRIIVTSDTIEVAERTASASGEYLRPA
jgi:hypothetical protein